MTITEIPEQARDRHAGTVSSIQRELSASPELRLLAGVIARALQDAKAGDAEAASWLASPDALPLIERLSPADVAPDQLQLALIAAAGREQEPQRAAPGRLEQIATRRGL